MAGKHMRIKLLEQDLKVYEKTLQKRRRDIVKIDKKPFGFQPVKPTVDTILYYHSCRESLNQKRRQLGNLVYGKERYKLGN